MVSVEAELEPGRVYRTRDLAPWGVNTPRLAKRLVAHGKLYPLAHGLYMHPRRGRFGLVPPTDEELMRAFLDDTPFVFSGAEYWNLLGLGTTGVQTVALVYNTKRSGLFRLGERGFQLRRREFPLEPPAEWYVVDLLENANEIGASRGELIAPLGRALKLGAFDRDKLRQMAERYATKKIRALLESAISAP